MTDRVARSEIEIPVAEGRVGGSLSVPAEAQGLVIFAHGSGSSRFSPRNQAVAARLQKNGFSTLLMDLLTAAEERIDDVTAELRFDIPFLARRQRWWRRRGARTSAPSFRAEGAGPGRRCAGTGHVAHAAAGRRQR